MEQQTEEKIKALDEFKAHLNMLNYVVNHLGIDDSFNRTQARKALDYLMISFNAYIQTLIK